MAVDYNNWKTWMTAEIHTPPSSVNIAAYQNRIDEICGFTPSGKSTVLLTWMPAMENYSKYYCEWDKGGFGIKSHLRGTYKFVTLYDPDGNPIDVPPPRWALKQWQSGVQYMATDEQSRWQKAETNIKYEQTEHGMQRVAGQTFLREVRPSHPKEGRYIPFMRIGKHDGFCCKREQVKGNACYGEYREPDGAYLEVLRSAVKLRSEEVNGQNPNEPISIHTLTQAAKEAAEKEEGKRQRTAELVKGLVNETFDEIMIQASGDDSGRTKYSFGNFKQNNGIYIPNLN